MAALVVALDQASKTWALGTLADGRALDLFWTLRLKLSFNSGVAFSLGRGIAPLLVVPAVVALVVGLVLLRRTVVRPIVAVALGLVVGGALGNLVDRFLRGHDGAVVDFVDLQWWPVFNLADAAIVCGAALVLVFHRTTDDTGPAGSGPAGSGPAGSGEA